jgi:LysR family transcriptional activator of glutamate synthase operon
MSVPFTRIAREPLILYPPECSIRKKITSLIEGFQIQPTIKTEIQFGEFIIGYVATGAGILCDDFGIHREASIAVL